MKVINDAGIKENPIENIKAAIVPYALVSYSCTFLVYFNGELYKFNFTFY
jgi:hypothetical protein